MATLRKGYSMRECHLTYNAENTLSHKRCAAKPSLGGFECTTPVVIGTDCICCKFNYYAITTTKATLRIGYCMRECYLIYNAENPTRGPAKFLIMMIYIYF